MNGEKTLRGKTRRIQGRRSITPIRRKHKLAVMKTRSNTKVDGLPILQSANTLSLSERIKTQTDTKEYSLGEKRQGNEGGDSTGERQDKEVSEASLSCGYSENPEESVHPGSIQGVPSGSPHALTQVTNETQHEEEEPPF